LTNRRNGPGRYLALSIRPPPLRPHDQYRDYYIEEGTCGRSIYPALTITQSGSVHGQVKVTLREPNDLTLDAKGGFYFADPGPYDPEKAASDGTVHHVDPQGKTHLVTQRLAYPNGIVIRPDGKTLLVGESLKNRILTYEIRSLGKIGPMKTFANLPVKQGEQIDNQPDGMCLDAEGSLYVAHFGMGQVQVLDPQGKLVRRYSAGNLSVSNVAFGGPRMDQLYLTGSIGIWDKTEGALFRAWI
jgi:gluconolactonase